jgi:hypothetical protein
MQLLHIFCVRTVRCVVVALFITILVSGSLLELRGSIKKLTEPQSITAEAARVSSDRVFRKNYKFPEPVANLVQKETHMQSALGFYSYWMYNKMEYVIGSLTQAVDKEKKQIRFYILYLLGVLFLLKKQSVITYLHKRDIAGVPTCLFGI